MRDNLFLLLCWGLSTQSVNWAAAFKIVQIIMSTSVTTWWMPPSLHSQKHLAISLTNLSKSLHLGSEMIISRKPVEALWLLKGLYQKQMALFGSILKDGCLWQGPPPWSPHFLHASPPNTPAFIISADIWQHLSLAISSKSQTNPLKTLTSRHNYART
jgi:hypothetical protein